MGLTDIYRALHPKPAECTPVSGAHGTLSRTDHKLGHRVSLGKFKKTESISSIFSDHNSMRSEINCKKKIPENTKTWKLNNVTKQTTDC